MTECSMSFTVGHLIGNPKYITNKRECTLHLSGNPKRSKLRIPLQADCPFILLQQPPCSRHLPQRSRRIPLVHSLSLADTLPSLPSSCTSLLSTQPSSRATQHIHRFAPALVRSRTASFPHESGSARHRSRTSQPPCGIAFGATAGCHTGCHSLVPD